VMLSLDGRSATVTNHATTFYSSSCLKVFDSYVRDIDISPSGSFYVVSTTGGYRGADSACDTTARFEVSTTGTQVKPSWVDSTGGDTTHAVAVTRSAVYVGGHQRWQNNPHAKDAAGPGAVSRRGIAALDPLNGLPLTWNPTRSRGVGVFDFLPTRRGLWVASDTDQIGGTFKSRIAFLSASGGAVVPTTHQSTLPADLYLSASKQITIVNRRFSGKKVGATRRVPAGNLDWRTVRGAFMLNGNLYTALTNCDFSRRSFNGTSYGSPTAVDTSDEIVELATWAADLRRVTGMFYDAGRVYFTLSGSTRLYYRYFTPESDVVGAQRYVASGGVDGVNFKRVRGMFKAKRGFFWATPNGVLHRAAWRKGTSSGRPVGNTARSVSGPRIDRKSWSGRALFLYQG
jgi:hypothetical protein